MVMAFVGFSSQLGKQSVSLSVCLGIPLLA